jgi:hypothetical protein
VPLKKTREKLPLKVNNRVDVRTQAAHSALLRDGIRGRQTMSQELDPGIAANFTPISRISVPYFYDFIFPAQALGLN